MNIPTIVNHFGVTDYIIFSLMLATCFFVGVFFMLKDRQKQKIIKQQPISEENVQADEYLLGGRNLQVVPVAMSLIASGLSGIALLGFPTETYLHGYSYWMIGIPFIFVGLITNYVVIPVFHELQIVSIYAYFEKRFNHTIRVYASVLYIFGLLMVLPVTMYAPALAFNQVSGISVHLISPIVCLICITYTLIGGIKAVVWTDLIQIILMFGSLILIVCLGVSKVGGFSVLLERNIASTRIEPPIWSLNPTIRHSVWSLLIGGTQFWMTLISLNQSMIQRYISLPTLAGAKKALHINIFGLFMLLSFCCFNGLLMYANYFDCDPLTTKMAKKVDQMLPLYTMELFKDLAGMNGMFIAGIFSASLSSMSSQLNSVSAVILEDFFKPNCKKPLSEGQTRFLLRATVFVFGGICVGLVYVVEKLGSVLWLGMTISIAASGPLLGMFTIGFLMPFIKPRAVFIGANVGLAVALYIPIRAQAAIKSGELFIENKPFSVEGCNYEFTEAVKNSTVQSNDGFGVHHISYLYFSVLGTITTITVACLISLALGFHDSKEVDSRLLAPCVRKYFKNKNDATIAHDHRK